MRLAAGTKRCDAGAGPRVDSLAGRLPGLEIGKQGGGTERIDQRDVEGGQRNAALFLVRRDFRPSQGQRESGRADCKVEHDSQSRLATRAADRTCQSSAYEAGRSAAIALAIRCERKLQTSSTFSSRSVLGYDGDDR